MLTDSATAGGSVAYVTDAKAKAGEAKRARARTPRNWDNQVSSPAQSDSITSHHVRSHSTRIADLVQDLYLKELKSYKPTPVKPSDAEGNVQVWSAPKPPKSPEEADIANELKSYESSTVELEGQGDSGAPAAIEQDWFEEEPEQDEHAAH
ncbi:MAG: hypothetical protein M1818_005485 [Claussenomyces sp. TS43310]|nr:MAG: hypothetical protein M1818_005485 [Claussenomyces sp. TS43310]